MQIKQLLPFAVCGAALVLALAFSGVMQPKVPTAATADEPKPATADSPAPKQSEPMRGIWVTYMELSMANEADKSEQAFRDKFGNIARDCAECGFNALFVQVRPFCDALYRSALFPASHVLSGEQGADVGYDALQIMCEICRANGLEIHAWVNPYRVQVNGVPQTFSADSPYQKQPQLCVTTESGVFLDPSSEDARRLIVDGMREIVNGYDVDGIQFDDYFYPPDIGDADEAQYQAYLDSAESPSILSRAAWREMNVNLLMSEVYMAVHDAKPDAVFGISPQGNLGNNKEISADAVSWCCVHGYADYVCPQIYFSPDNPRLGFYDALDEWLALERDNSVTLYVGLAGYKAGTDSDEGTWLDRDDILAEEYQAVRDNKSLGGAILYSYAALNDEQAEAEMGNFRLKLKALSE